MEINRLARLQPVNADRDEFDAAAALCAVIGLRKKLRRWRMSRAIIARMIGHDCDGSKFAKLQNALADYGVLIFEYDNLDYGLQFMRYIAQWPRFGSGALTDVEKSRPDVYLLEDEILACDLDVYGGNNANSTKA